MVIFYVPNKRSSNNSNVLASSLTHNRSYLLTLLIFGLVALVQFSFRMLLSLWIKLPLDHQGLGWDKEKNVGYVNSLGGIILIFFPLFFTPYLTATFGIKQTCMIVILSMIPITLIMPQLYLLQGPLLWISLSTCIGFFISFTTVFTSVISIAVTNSVSHDLVGRAMGICQSFVALFRSLGNATGVLFGFNINWNIGYPFDTHFVFYLCGFCLMSSYLILKYSLGQEIEKRKIENKDNTKEIEVPLIEKNS